MVWPWVAGYGVSAGLNVLLAVGAWRRRHLAPAFMACVVMLLSCAAYVFANLLIVVWADLPGATAVLVLLLLTDSLVVAAFYCLSMLLTDRGWRPSRRLFLLLSAEPVVATVLLSTNGLHHRYYTGGPQLDEPLGGTGPWQTVHMLFLYTLAFWTIFRLMRAWWQNPREQRRIYSWILVAALCPIIASVITVVLGLSQELTPIGMAITAVVNYRALMGSGLPAQVSIGRQRVVETMQDAVVVLDRAGIVLDTNPAAQQLLRRLRPDNAGGQHRRSFGELFGIDVELTDGAHLYLHLADAQGVSLDVDLSINALLDRRGAAIGWALVARDTTELNDRRREAEEATRQLRQQLATIEALRADLAEQAVRDPLTGLHNRRHLMDALADLYAQDRPFSLIMLDIDHFKQVNDTHGHNVGDAVLKLVARHLGSHVRVEDTVARHGGEEFVVLMTGATPEDARARMDDMREHVAAASRIEEPRIPITFSAGIAAASRHADPADLLHAADQALYTAKRRGRNRVEVADPASSAAA